jgi:hypothetical protein
MARRGEEAGLERSTRDHYRQHVNEHIKPFLGALKLTTSRRRESTLSRTS